MVLVHGDLRAVITEVGATLRSLRVRGEPVLWEFPVHEIASSGRGQVLAPWPNRLEDGWYRYGEVVGKAALDEPERSNAIHGLVRWLAWSLEERSTRRAVLSCVLQPQPAYPFRIRLELDYMLVDRGLEVTCEVTNTGAEPAPFGIGFHPYLVPSTTGIDDAEIHLVAARRLLLDERALPRGEEPVAGSAFDLDGRTLDSLRLDDCYTGLQRQSDGRWRALLNGPTRRLALWADPAFGYAMCFTGDSLDAGHRRGAIAIEPMTCPPNALRTGTDLIALMPGEPWKASWGIADLA